MINMPVTTSKKHAGKKKHRNNPAGALSVKVKPKAPRPCRTENPKARS
jgi:hypothetical protein